MRMGKKNSGVAFAEAAPEERLLDYAKRLARFRKGRIALHLKLSRLGREYRQERYLRQAEGPLRSLLQTHEGEIFRLNSGDIICVVKDAEKELDSAVLRIVYLLRDDAALKSAIDRGDEIDFLTTRHVLQTDYADFLALAEASLAALSERPESGALAFAPVAGIAAPAPAAPSSQDMPKGYAPIVKKKPAIAPREIDADAYARLERAVASADLARFLEREPVRVMIGDRPGAAILQDCAVDLDLLIETVMPGYAIPPEPWFAGRLNGILGDRLLASEFEIKAEGLTAVFLRLSLANALGPALDRLLARQASAGAKLVIAVPAREAMANPMRTQRARERLSAAGLRLALVDFDPIHFAIRDRSLVPSDFDSVDWRRVAAWEATGGDALQRICAALKAADPARTILEHCDGREALEFGRSLGLRLFSGPALREA